MRIVVIDAHPIFRQGIIRTIAQASSKYERRVVTCDKS
jgi:DNA-binding NarL/FixJ family response regulator